MMPLRRRLTLWNVGFLIASLALAAVFVRLGIWQLHRLAERRIRNATVFARLQMAPASLDAMPSDTALAQYRRVRLVGTYDYAHEMVLTGRTRDGSPGIHFITPLRTPGLDTAVLVDRGWVYAPDAASANIQQWREPASVDTTGFIEEMPKHVGHVSLPGPYVRVRWLDPDSTARFTGYPIRPIIIMLAGDTAARSLSVPARVSPPPLGEGPHLSYAIQWFSFALIAVVGACIAVLGPPSSSVELAPDVIVPARESAPPQTRR